jgi:hypothetical protein
VPCHATPLHHVATSRAPTPVVLEANGEGQANRVDNAVWPSTKEKGSIGMQGGAGRGREGVTSHIIVEVGDRKKRKEEL